MKLLITRGVPASGKSTFAKSWVLDGDVDAAPRVRLNRDDLRFQMFGKYWGVDEQAVTVAQHALMVAYFKNRYDVVLDNTNLRARDVKESLALAEKWGYEVEFKDFPVTKAIALARDKARERQVGEEVIEMFFQRFIRKGQLPPVPTLDAAPQFPMHEHVEGLPHAIIVDIDGTIAHMNGRGPYDNSLVHTDLFDEVIGQLAYLWSVGTNATVIVMSGRDAGCRPQTVEWMRDNNFYYDEFYMRPEGDQRNDAVVKNELFEQHIAGRYNVDFALDDRNRVVDMWRDKGIKVLQVAPGDF